MNIYNYKCQACDETFKIQAEIQEKESADCDKFKCPKCESKEIKEECCILNFFKNLFSGKKSVCCSGEKSGSDKTPEKSEKSDCGCDEAPKKSEEKDCCSDDKNCCG